MTALSQRSLRFFPLNRLASAIARKDGNACCCFGAELKKNCSLPDVIVVYSALGSVGDSQEQIEMALLDLVVGIIPLSEQTARAYLLFSEKIYHFIRLD